MRLTRRDANEQVNFEYRAIFFSANKINRKTVKYFLSRLSVLPEDGMNKNLFEAVCANK